MMKETFMPNWYKDKKNQIRNKKIKTCIMVISIINIVLLSFILNISNKTKNIDKNIGNKSNDISVVKTVERDVIIIEKYKKLNDFLSENNLSYKNIIINKDNFEIDIEVKDYEEYIDGIRCIEDNYSIKKLIPNIKKVGKYNFKVILEV